MTAVGVLAGRRQEALRYVHDVLAEYPADLDRAEDLEKLRNQPAWDVAQVPGYEAALLLAALAEVIAAQDARITELEQGALEQR